MKLELQDVQAQHPAAARGTTALRGVSLMAGAGELIAVIGPSGAGKTTLLQVAGAALRPSAGRVMLGGTDVWAQPTRALQRQRGQLFMAPQVPPLPPRQRVVTAVLAGRLPDWSLSTSLRSLFYPKDIAGAHAALERFDLADKLFARVDRLSGGERQRVGLARALLSSATLWLVDEPLSALDPTRSQQAIRELIAIARERGVTLLTSMHQVDTALEHFPRIVGLRDGAVLFDLPTSQVGRDELERLYVQHEDELAGGSGPVDAAPPLHAKPQPAVMHCR
ncbi:MAG: ATP-binding cassette domain-containing protein [Burkholderiales bacterium]